MLSFWILLQLTMMEVVMTIATTGRAQLQPNCHHQQTTTQLFTSCHPTKSVKAL